MPAAKAQPAFGALALAGAKAFIHLRLQELLHGDLDDPTDEILVLANYGFEFAHGVLTVFSGHGFLLGSGCLVAPFPTMTRFLFAELSGHHRSFRCARRPNNSGPKAEKNGVLSPMRAPDPTPARLFESFRLARQKIIHLLPYLSAIRG